MPDDRSPRLLIRPWWRFDRYEVRDGYVRPSDGAQLEFYDPWVAYEESLRLRKGARRPPYIELVDLAKAGRTSRAELERGLPGWCQRFGPLGILLDRTAQATLWPSAESFPEARPESKGKSAAAPLISQRTYTRVGALWSHRINSSPLPRSIGVGPEKELPRSFQEPSTIMLDEDDKLFRASLAESWGPFFPDVGAEDAERHTYPRPGTDDFYRTYAEPVDEFRRAANRLAMIVEWFEEYSSDKGRYRDRTDAWVIAEFNRLSASVSPIVGRDDRGQLGQRWVAPSLLSALARMAQLDLAGDSLLRFCSNCGAAFVTRAPSAKYCSARCRDTFHHRQSRERKKEQFEPET